MEFPQLTLVTVSAHMPSSVSLYATQTKRLSHVLEHLLPPYGHAARSAILWESRGLNFEAFCVTALALTRRYCGMLCGILTGDQRDNVQAKVLLAGSVVTLCAKVLRCLTGITRNVE